MIPIVLSFSRTLASIASYLDRNPTILKQQNANLPDTDSSGGGGKVSFIEDTANVLRDAFIKCLAGSSGIQRTTNPTANDDKRVGIYLTANATLKLLFQARKLRNAQQMFLSIDAQSPPLSFYPAAQRVTYLYYLGRYHFANNHFHRSAIVLQSAYNSCHAQATTHRRQILTYLIASNICLGKFPSEKFLIRPDARSLGEHFLPLLRLIQSGDVGGFESFLSLSSPTATWFLQRRILLQLRNRCEVLVWRSLIRKCFVIAGYHGEGTRMPFLRLNVVRDAARFSINRARSLSQNTNAASEEDEYIDPEFRDIKAAELATGFSIVNGSYTSTEEEQQDLFPPPSALPLDQQPPTLFQIESIFLSLIHQGFLRGFINRSAAGPRFAIPKSRVGGGPVLTGFADIYHVINSRDEDEGTVPGWVRIGDGGLGGGGHGGGMGAGTGGSMAGRVVNLKGARAVGVQ